MPSGFFVYSPTPEISRKNTKQALALIRELRRANGWSEIRACREIGISARSVRRWKQGSSMRRACFDKLCEYFQDDGRRLCGYELSGPADFTLALSKASPRDVRTHQRALGYAVVWFLAELQVRKLAAVASSLGAASAEVLLTDRAGAPCAGVVFSVRNRRLWYEAVRVRDGKRKASFRGPATEAGFGFCVEYFSAVSQLEGKKVKQLVASVTKEIKRHGSINKRTA